MAKQAVVEQELLVFNGIDGNSGEYLLPPMAPQSLVRVALGESLDPDFVSQLNLKGAKAFVLADDLDPDALDQAGWGIVFPADADATIVDAIRDALSELLSHRKSQAQALYKEFVGADGYWRDETSSEWLGRHNASPGTVEPENVPYYLLLVGDPQSIPYRFQYELDVDRAVGRIVFDTLDEYAQYARSVKSAETPGVVARRRKTVFFGVQNDDDRATRLSTEQLVQPLYEKLSQELAGKWDFDFVEPKDARKARLSKLLGGDETPAFLFTGSHGVGFPLGDPSQLEFQGALLCGDWGGPYAHDISRDHYLGAEDIASDANLLGLISFHFACYSAGTPYWDEFFERLMRAPAPVAPRAFVASLPRRMLSHPRGGALAVVGHVERAWTYSFQWAGAEKQTASFRDTLKRLLSGSRLGYAIEPMNLRYASLAAQLAGALKASKHKEPKPAELVPLWTGHSDARGYAIIGDPAVKLAAADEGAPVVENNTIEVVVPRAGSLPTVLDPGSMPASSQTLVSAGQPASASLQVDAANAMAMGASMDGLRQAMQQLTDSIVSFAKNVTSLEVATFTADDMDTTQYDTDTRRFGAGAKQRALTHISIDGDTKVCVPLKEGELDTTIWEIHNATVQQACANRAEMIRIFTELLNTVLPKGLGT